MAGRDAAALRRCCSIPKSRTPSAAIDILRNFAFDVCGCRGDWTMASFVDESDRADPRAGRRRAASSAACRAAWTRPSRRCCIHRAHRRPADLHLRRQRPAAARRGRRRCARGSSACSCRSSSSTRRDLFLDRLAGVTDPEQKRKIIGATFIDVFETARARAGRVRLPGAGHALSGRHRERVGRRPVGGDQEPPQRRRPARAHALQAGRAAARALQGRSARGRAGRSGSTTSSSGASRFPGRAWRCACSGR